MTKKQMLKKVKEIKGQDAISKARRREIINLINRAK